ncbi:MAG: flagellar basal body-associated FliL family protein [Oscillospiraceae bacterium]|jgi:flagellar basal body-associated protein FliL|nr:flagellar basal body-associated FliL family protein [Oscillospiraceae bacterium]
MTRIKKIIAAVLCAALALTFLASCNKEVPVNDKPIYYQIPDQFVTNVAASNHLLRTIVVLVVYDEKMLETLDAKGPVIRNELIQLLRPITSKQINPGEEDGIDPNAVLETLKSDILARLNELLSGAGVEIREVLITDFVMQ